MTQDRDRQARNRFIALNVIRLTGALMLTFGLLAISGALRAIPLAAGYALFVVGLVEFLVLPVLLSRAWKNPDR